MQVLGVDIGGTGIKLAPVATDTGELLQQRLRVTTPQPSTPAAVAKTVAGLVAELGWDGPIGCGFPAVIKQGVARTAANIDPTWVGTDVANLLADATGQTVAVVNDADAAGMAEIRFGAGFGVGGTVILVTIGTGLGSAIFTDGKLLPNTELGHLWLDGRVAEHYASEGARKRNDLKWSEWSRRFEHYLLHLERLFCPDLIILGGGGSKKHEKFLHRLAIKTPLLLAKLFNDAGIVGAAIAGRP